MPECRDCLHRFLCSILEHKGYQQDCRQFVDRSLFVVLPCKVGDTLYTVVRGYKIREWIVTDICFSNYSPVSGAKTITARGKRNIRHIRFAEHYFGKTVFLTRADAEQSLKRR